MGRDYHFVGLTSKTEEKCQYELRDVMNRHSFEEKQLLVKHNADGRNQVCSMLM